MLPFSGAGFPDLLRRTYIGVKHADRARPDVNEGLLAYLQAVQVVRAWVGSRLGVSKGRLQQALRDDTRSLRILELYGELALAGSKIA